MNQSETTLTEFRDLAELRDAVLAARPPSPHAIAAATLGARQEHALLAGFVFPPFDLNSNRYHEVSVRGAHAFAEGLIDLPYPVFTGRSPVRRKADAARGTWRARAYTEVAWS